MIFKVGVCVSGMSDARGEHSGTKSVLMIICFFLASMSPLLSPDIVPELGDNPLQSSFSSPFNQTSGYGHDFASPPPFLSMVWMKLRSEMNQFLTYGSVRN